MVRERMKLYNNHTVCKASKTTSLPSAEYILIADNISIICFLTIMLSEFKAKLGDIDSISVLASFCISQSKAN